MDRLARNAGAYFLLQAAAVAAWWALLAAVPSTRVHFRIDPASDATLLAFWLPDLLVLAGASAVAGVAALRRSSVAALPAWVAATASVYATLYCVAGVALTDAGWLSVALMLPSAVVSAAFAVGLTPEARALLRPSPPRAAAANLRRTGLQILLFWSVLLAVFPALLLRVQAGLGWVFVQGPGIRAAGIAIFAGCSALGLWSATSMVLRGEGTPLPLESARRLVVRGPYAYLRNPMALAGLGQGMGVAVLTGSVVVAAYVLLGSLLWQYVARPLEEEELERRFGEAYRDYCASVRCWLPRVDPFRPRAAAPAPRAPAPG